VNTTAVTPRTDPLFALEGKTAVVTGGGAGLGAMIAEGLCQRGVKVIIAGRKAGALAETAGRLAILGECHAVTADVATAEGRAVIAGVVDRMGGALDILVNNAGAMRVDPIESLSEQDWDTQVDVNMKAVFFMVQALLEPLRKSGSASIINIGSIAGLRTRPREVHPYAAAKAGVHQLTRTLARRLGSDGIRVNAIAPGVFPTDMLIVQSGPVYEAAVAAIPVGRIGEAEDIVGMTVFLAARASRYVNGTVIPLDGGMSL